MDAAPITSRAEAWLVNCCSVSPAPDVSFAAPADIAWKSCALRNADCDPRWVPNQRGSHAAGALQFLRGSRES